MDPDDLVIAAFGVLLTQVRTARRALEDVQRSTSRYQGFEFAQALSQGSRFGAPPMFEGALRVHVVNINDLAPGNSFGGFLEALFGGIGNFFSNLFAGTVGGLISSWALPSMIKSLDRIVENIKYIVDKIGVGEEKKEDKSLTPEQAAEAEAKKKAKPETGETLLTTLAGVESIVKAVTALFQAAVDGPGGTAGANKAGDTSQLPLTKTGERWMAILHGINRVLDRTVHLVTGLTILIPHVLGAISLLVVNLGAIRKALLETIQFVLRNALILKGVLLTVIFETVASAARLAASIVGILGATIQSMLASIVGAVQALLAAVFDALRTLTAALQAIVESLLQWLVTGVFKILRDIGKLEVFATVDHLIRVIPALLPAIYALMNQGKAPPDEIMKMLNKALEASFPDGKAAGPAGGGTPGVEPPPVDLGKFPDLDKILKPLEAKLKSAVDDTAKQLQDAVKKTFDDASGTLTGLAGRFDKAVKKEVEFSRGIQKKHVGRITKEADTLAGAITKPIEAVDTTSGLEGIAKAYQDWLTKGGGLDKLGPLIQQHFVGKPAEGEPGGALKLLRGQFDRPRASIEIDRLEIVIEPPQEPNPVPLPATGGLFGDPALSDEQIYLAVLRHSSQLEARGIKATDLPAAHVA